MRNLKKFLALVLAMMMAFSLMVTVNAASINEFTDGVTDKFVEAVDVLNGMGVFKGRSEDNKFHPGDYITRAEVAAILYRVTTADVNNRQADIYKDYGRFKDVTENDWFAGYVNLMYDRGLVTGYSANGDGTDEFGPYDNVTGYQVLAMFLRAVGYGQNGELVGANGVWQFNAASLANQLRITRNIDEGTLSQYATREAVAEMIFRAIQVPMVTWTSALSYQTQHYDTSSGGIVDNDSLGVKNFGLTSHVGIVNGNQDTGERYTKITPSASVYGYARGESYDFETGLGLFGHAVTVWYDGTDTQPIHTYAILDEATVVAVIDGDVTTYGALADAGFDIGTTPRGNPFGDAQFKANGTVYGSDSYGQIAKGTNPLDTKDYPFYVMISNSAAKTVDVVIGIDAAVVQVNKINNYIATPNVTFGGTIGTNYGTAGVVDQDHVIAGLENAIVGKYVILNKITTTTYTAPGDELYTIDTVGSNITNMVSTVNTTTGAVTLIDGSVIERSPLYCDSTDTSLHFSEMADDSSPEDGIDDILAGGVMLTFTLDHLGKYVGVTQAAPEYLYVTYAYWEQTGTSTIKYYLQGVTLDGQVSVIEVDQGSYTAAAGASVAYKKYQNDEIDPGSAYVLMTISGKTATVVPDGSPTNINDAIIELENEGPLSKTSDRFADTTKFLYDTTVFYVIDGFGDTLTVTPYTGVDALVGDATSVTIPTGFYTTYPLTSTDTTISNWGVDNVLIDGSKMTIANSGSYLYTGKTLSGGAIKQAGNANIAQYNLYVAGEATTTAFWVNISGGAPLAATYYTYIRAYDPTLGIDVYTLSAATSVTPPATTAGSCSVTTLDETASSYGKYVVISSTEYEVASDVTVIDLSGVSKIDSVTELNTALETSDVTANILFNSSGKISVIYITAVATAAPRP